MSLNNEYRFGALPKTNIPRSVFYMQHNWKGTFNTGEIIPIYVNQQIIPSDTFKVKQSCVIRMQTPITPTMDDLVADFYYFSVPYRLVWDNFKKFMGENTSGTWTQTADLEIPQTTVPSNSTTSGIPTSKSIWAYMGLPIGIKGANANHPISVSSLPFRAYGEIYNYFFRNQNLIAPINISKSDTTLTYSISYAHRGGAPLIASKLPDYFTTALPEPQKGNPVTVGIAGTASVKFGKSIYDATASDTNLVGLPVEYTRSGIDSETANKPLVGIKTVGDTTTIEGQTADSINSLYADLSEATAATINALRLAVQTQMIYERDGMFGTRYFDEILYGHFGTTSGAAKYEKPEFLGSKRVPIQMNQVAQTAPSTYAEVGNTGAFSLTADVDTIFTKSFTEHSILMGVVVVRQLRHTTQQGIPRQWSMRKRLDLLWHEYEHLGNQPIYNKEIYADGSATDEEVFGYQERYAEYRTETNTICGELKSTLANPLDFWHYGDLYNNLPVLSQNWIEETAANVNRSIAVQNHDQFIADITLYIKATRPIRVFGTPGYMDHF